MGRTTISISDTLKDRIRGMGRMGESYDAVLLRVIGENGAGAHPGPCKSEDNGHEKIDKERILKLLSQWREDRTDEKEVIWVIEQITEEIRRW